MTQRGNENRWAISSPQGDPAAEPSKEISETEKSHGSLTASPWDLGDTTIFSLIVLLAALLRFLHLNYMEFNADEANNLFLAAGLVSGKSFPLVGVTSSIGTLNPPLFIYLLGIPMLFSRSPVFAAGFIALLNCAAVGLSYVFCRRYFGRTAAVFAAALFAVNPWAVFYSRKIWQQELLPPFVVGFFFSLFAVVYEKRSRQLLTCVACLAAATQLHLSSVYFGVVLVLVLAWFRPKVGWRIYLSGFAIGLALYIPYFLFELMNRGYNAEIYLRAFRMPSHFHPEALLLPFAFGSTLGFMHFFEWPLLDTLQLLFFVLGVVYLFFRWRDPRCAILLLWYFVPTAFLVMSKLVLAPHYFICYFPIQFVVMGIAADMFMQNRRSRNKILGYVKSSLLAVLITYQLLSSARFVTAIAKPGPLEWAGYGPRYGPPYRVRLQEIRALAQKGIVDPEAVQKALVQDKPKAIADYYDFDATKYIVENLGAL